MKHMIGNFLVIRPSLFNFGCSIHVLNGCWWFLKTYLYSTVLCLYSFYTFWEPLKCEKYYEPIRFIVWSDSTFVCSVLKLEKEFIVCMSLSFVKYIQNNVSKMYIPHLPIISCWRNFKSWKIYDGGNTISFFQLWPRIMSQYFLRLVKLKKVGLCTCMYIFFK